MQVSSKIDYNVKKVDDLKVCFLEMDFVIVMQSKYINFLTIRELVVSSINT